METGNLSKRQHGQRSENSPLPLMKIPKPNVGLRWSRKIHDGIFTVFNHNRMKSSAHHKRNHTFYYVYTCRPR